LLGHSLVERIVGVGGAQQGLDTEQNRANLQSGRPVVLQYVQADAAKSVDVRVIDASEEAYPWWAHRVVVGEEELEVESAAWFVVSILSLIGCSYTFFEHAYLRSSSHRVRPPTRRSIVRSRHVALPRCQAPARSVTSPSL
jgi:hypothetical protein